MSTSLTVLASLLLLTPLSYTIFLLFVLAVMLSAWLGGLGPGLVAGLLSSLASIYLLLVAQGPNSSATGEDVLSLAIFSGVAILLSWLLATRRHADGVGLPQPTRLIAKDGPSSPSTTAVRPSPTWTAGPRAA